MTLIFHGLKSKSCDIHVAFRRILRLSLKSMDFGYGPLDAVNAFVAFFDWSISKIFSFDWSI